MKVAVNVSVGRRGGAGRLPRVRTASALPDAAAVRRLLLRWYSRAGRDLPWRRSRDPYRVWVSEIMLQQTQVERVKEFFARFMARFPSVAALAAADEQEVLGLWEGLGYYRRARQLHAAAGRIVAEHAGILPRSVQELRRLPGIGRYTAGAIASIAMDLPEPIVEANSRRVIARLVGHEGRLDRPGDDEPIWEAARALVPKKGAGRFNEALMDLGAAVCTAERPRCAACPLESVCVGRRAGRAAAIPPPVPRRPTKRIREVAVVVHRGGCVLVERRPEGGWWAGLWDFPRVRCRPAQLPRVIRESTLLGPLGCGDPVRLGTIVHTVTHHRITLDVMSCSAARKGRLGAGLAWVSIRQVAGLAMTSPGRRIAGMID